MTLRNVWPTQLTVTCSIHCAVLSPLQEFTMLIWSVQPNFCQVPKFKCPIKLHKCSHLSPCTVKQLNPHAPRAQYATASFIKKCNNEDEQQGYPRPTVCALRGQCVLTKLRCYDHRQEHQQKPVHTHNHTVTNGSFIPDSWGIRKSIGCVIEATRTHFEAQKVK